MRFKEEAHKLGTTRERTFFAWRPVTVGKETRWLEQVTVLQRWVMSLRRGEDDHWCNVEFLNK